MAQNNRYKYYFKDDSGDYYYVDSTGAVLTQASAIEIPFAPKAWDDKVLEWVRGFESYGIVTNVTDSLDYVLDAAKILRHLFYTYGANAYCLLYIEVLDDSAQTYSKYFSGEIDFNEVSDRYTNIGAPVSDGSYSENLKNLKSTDYELDLDNSFYVRMDGMSLRSKVTLTTIDEKGSPFPTMYDNIRFTQSLQIGLAVIDDDGSELVGYFQGQYSLVNNYLGANLNPLATNFLMAANRDSELSMDLDYKVALRNQGIGGGGTQDDIKLRLYITIQDTDGSYTTEVLYTTPSWQVPSGATTIYNFQFTVAPTNPILKGQKIFISHGVTWQTFPSVSNWEYDIAIEEGTITMNFDYQLEDSYIEVKRCNDLFTDLVDEISDSAVVADSTFLDNNDDYVLTSGNALRALADAKLKTNFNDFWQSFSNIFCLGQYYDKINEEHIIVEREDLFDGATQILDIGDLTDVEIYQNQEILFNKLLIGYPEIKVEGLNGKEAFNCKFEFSSPLEGADRTLDMTSAYIADPYEIEIYRANLDGQDTTIAKEDNNVYIMRIESSIAGTYNGRDYYDLKRYTLVGSSGLTFPNDVYNLDITPKRNLERNGSYLRGILTLMDSESLVFNTADRNQDLITDIGSGNVTENADVLISTLDSAMFYNFILKGKTAIYQQIQSLLDTNPYGYIDCEWLDNSYTAFLLSAMENPETKASQEITLLLTSSNDITKLIR